MTIEEAKDYIREWCPYDKQEEIIKALEQEPRKDEVILTNKEYRELLSSEFDNGYDKGYREALEQEPTPKKGKWIVKDGILDKSTQ